MSEEMRATRPEPPPHVTAEIDVATTPIPKWAVGEFLAHFFLCFLAAAAFAQR